MPIYRAGKLVGGIGVSGDGIDQDDMVAFLGLANASARVGVGNADPAIRADQLLVGPPPAQRLRFVNCPFAPFLDTSDQNVCQGNEQCGAVSYSRSCSAPPRSPGGRGPTTSSATC